MAIFKNSEGTIRREMASVVGVVNEAIQGVREVKAGGAGGK